MVSQAQPKQPRLAEKTHAVKKPLSGLFTFDLAYAPSTYPYTLPGYLPKDTQHRTGKHYANDCVLENISVQQDPQVLQDQIYGVDENYLMQSNA